MGAPALRGLYFGKLPPAQLTVMQLAGRVMEAQQAFRSANHKATPTETWNRLMYAEQEAAAAFFDALEDATGIDRDVFAKLAELA